MASTSTMMARVRRAIELLNTAELWVGIGKKTAWGNPDTPPAFDPINLPQNNVWWSHATALTEPIGYKKLEIRKLVIPDSSGVIEILDDNGNSTKWSEVSVENAYTQSARYLYVSTLLDSTLPYDTFRQSGIFSNLTKANGIPVGRNYLIPSEVADPGILELIFNHLPQPRTSTTRQRYNAVYEL